MIKNNFYLVSIFIFIISINFISATGFGYDTSNNNGAGITKVYLTNLTANVNDSNFLNGFNSSYFYPMANPSAYISDGNTLWNNIYGFITNTVNDLVNYFTKTEVVAMIDGNVSALDTLKLNKTDQRYNDTAYIDGIVSDNNASWTSTYNVTYAQWAYNQTYSGSTYNSTYDTWSYNQTYSGSTYNSTYDATTNQWNGNYSAYSPYWYNMTYSGSTYNSTYDTWAYNQTYTGGTYNSTYDTWAYNQTYSGSTYNSTYANKNTSQWLRNGGNIYYQNLTGSVGIGTTAPATPLDVLGTDIRALQIKHAASTTARETAYFQNTNSAGQGAFTLENDRGSYASYGGFLVGGSAQATAGLFGQANRQDKLFMYADGASNLGMYIGTLVAQPLVFGTTNLERMRILSGGNVGIGTTTPLTALHVVKADEVPLYTDSYSNSNYAAGVMGRRARGTIATPLALQAGDFINGVYGRGYTGAAFTSQSNGLIAITAGETWNTTATGTYIVFETTPNGSTTRTEKMRITGAGNVGIGTTAPTLTATRGLHIDGTTSEIHLTSTSGGGTTSTDGSVIQQWSDNGLYIWNKENASMSFGTNNNEKMRITGDGKVGIGTTSPSYLLTVGNGTGTNKSTISIYSYGNISAAGYITRTEVYDTSEGNALDKIKDASAYRNIDGTINHTAFVYSKVSYDKTVVDKVTQVEKTREECIEQPSKNFFGFEQLDEEGNQIMETVCEDVPYTEDVTTYKTIQEEGVSLDKEIALLKQAIYELKLENERIKNCAKESDYKLYQDCVGK